jgi:glycosyltransferase involved in cell wall biosynthesis
VLPSRSEARSNVIPEALSSGTAVAAAAVGGIPEIMHPSHGLLFAPESAAALREAVRALTADRDELAELGSRARSYILASDNTWEAHAAKTVSLYQSLL